MSTRRKQKAAASAPPSAFKIQKKTARVVADFIARDERFFCIDSELDEALTAKLIDRLRH